MSIRTKKKKVAPSSQGFASSNYGVWDAADREQLQRRLGGLTNDPRAAPLAWMFSPDAKNMLCTSKEHVHDRACAYVTQFNVIAGLVLSSIIGAALDPIDIAGIAADDRRARALTCAIVA